MDLDELTRPERALWKAFPRGELVDLSGARGTAWDAYDPQGGQRWLAYLLIAVGWIFVTTIAAGIARILRRQ